MGITEQPTGINAYRPLFACALTTIMLSVLIGIPTKSSADASVLAKTVLNKPENIPKTQSVLDTTRGVKTSPEQGTVDSVAPWVKRIKTDTLKNPVMKMPPGSQVIDRKQFDRILRKTVRDNTRKKQNVENDLWKRIRQGFGLPGYEQPRVDAQLNWYARHQDYIDRVTQRATPFLYHILNEVNSREMPTEIALLPIVESAFQPFAYSPGSAAGLWQFIPATGKRYGLKQNWWYDGRRDVYASTTAALSFLLDLYKHFDNDWLLALAAYNTGQGNVDRAIRKNLKKGKSIRFWALELPRETREYVPKLLAISALIAEPHIYDIRLIPIPDQPYFQRIDIGRQIDIALAARLADMPVDELFALNPAFNRWATAPDGPHYLLLPIASKSYFLNGLATIPKTRHIQWKRHRIRSGETLSHIARHYQTTVARLQEINNLKGKSIRAGSHLTVPAATRDRQDYELTKDRRTTTKRINYKVRKGDTLFRISRQFKVSVLELRQWNSLDENKHLQPGQNITVFVDITRQSKNI